MVIVKTDAKKNAIQTKVDRREDDNDESIISISRENRLSILPTPRQHHFQYIMRIIPIGVTSYQRIGANVTLSMSDLNILLDPR